MLYTMQEESGRICTPLFVCLSQWLVLGCSVVETVYLGMVTCIWYTRA